MTESTITNELKQNFNPWYGEKTTEEKAYLFGTLSFLLIIISLNVLVEKSEMKEYLYLLVIPITSFLFGFGNYLLTQSLIIKNPISKYLIGPASIALGASVAHAFSGQTINIAIQAASASFTHTQTILTILIAPLVLAISFALVGMFLAFLFFIDFSKLKNLEFLKDIGSFLPFLRIAIYMSTWMLSFAILNNYSETYDNYLEKVAKWSVYHLESEKFSHCEKTSEQRISYLTSGLILLSKKVNGEYEFDISKCIHKL